MKKLLLPILLVLVMAIPSFGATIIIKVSQFPNTTSPSGLDLFLLASGATNKNITWNQLKDAIGTNPPTITILNTLYSTNIITTNLTVNNEFHGKTTYIETGFITNLFLNEWTTNYFLFGTNIYEGDTYVSNYFQTNILIDTVISNHIYTNFYWTNIYDYSTNVTINQWFGGDTYLSNYFQTNIITDSYNSNYFETNIFQTINIYSNYTYQYDMNLTNPVFYGHAWIDGYANNPNPALTILSPNGTPIELDGESGDIKASGINADVFRTIAWTWDGPTNTMDMWTGDQYYRTHTPCQVTGFTDKPSDSWISWGYGYSGLLTITNASATNILLTLPPGMVTPENTNQYVISNACQGMLSIKWNPNSGTNGVFRLFPDGPSTNMVIVTNVTVSSPQFFATNAWAGPTNTLPLNLARQWYETYTPVSVTGYTGKSNTVTESVLLTITNAATTNVLLTLASGTMTGNYTNQYTISNASTAKIWFEYDPGANDTNAVFRQMK